VQFKKTLFLCRASFSNRAARTSSCTVITDLATSERSTQPSPAVAPSWKLVLGPRSKHEEWTAWTVPAADSIGYARVGWKMNFLSTFETAPFFCVCPVSATFLKGINLLPGSKWLTACTYSSKQCSCPH
jgi:hypothetical protein